MFTRRWVVDLVLDLAGYTPDKNLSTLVAVEPSAGEGAFLGPMVERLLASVANQGGDVRDCGKALVAFELDGLSTERTRALVRAELRKHRVPEITADALATSWVRCGDYLVDSTSIEADFVVGNPPYIRAEEIPAEQAAFYRRCFPTMRGRADIYIAFFEAALLQLREHGTCAFICADRWMRNQYGGGLREMITGGYALDVVVEMHEANAFEDEVDAYPAITVIRKRAQQTTVVAAMPATVENTAKSALTDALLSGGVGPSVPGLRIARLDRWFQGDTPWPCQSPEQLELLRQLEDRFPLLEAYARVGIGVATGNDGVFVTKNEKLVEPSRLLKLAMAKDLSTGRLCWSGQYLVDPWEREGLADLAAYPQLAAYFAEHETALKRRHTAMNNPRNWYRTIDRVTHSLAAKRKLYIADIKDVLNPVLDDGETYPHHNLYFVASEDWDLEVLGGLLLSAIGQFFVESYGVRMRGGYLRFQAQYLRRIRVPAPNSVTLNIAGELREAFRARNRDQATAAALVAYGISPTQLEAAIGHR
ncbi:MAG: Eco57I restriction-modification methylase domain-containing protein [Bryobacterales bacterium]|nr:Eco57I restriction-modification methylase domain-containing protein [Bryobacterales bacterium]